MPSSPRTVSCRVTLGDDSTTDVVLKGHCQEDGTVWWDLRILCRFVLDKPVVRLGQFVDKTLHGAWSLALALGISAEADVQRSDKSRRARGGDEEADGEQTQEFRISSRAMIHVLLWMAKHRRQHAEKQRAQALLGALLQGRHEQDFLIQAVWAQPPLGLCDMGRDHAGACTCYRRYQEAPQVFQGAKHERVVQKLLMLLGEAEEHECDTLFGLLSNLLVRLARGLCDFVAAQEPASYADLQQVVLRGHKRRLRVDPHSKEEALKKVCGRSGWSLAEALVNTVMEGEYPQRWVHSYLLQYMEA